VNENPYPGLRAFEEEDFHLFFGRDEQIDELLRRLSKGRFLCVTGVSGGGKSSLVKAGLIPALRRGYAAGAGSRWRIATCRPGDDPIAALAAALSKDANVSTDLERSGYGLVHAAQSLLPGENLLVAIDQFEELFRYKEKIRAADDAARRDKAKGAERAADFIRLLLTAAADESVPVYIVLTMRSDYLGECAQFRDFPEALNVGQYLIPRMTRDQRREAIVGPLGPTPISPALVQQLLNDAGDEPNQLPVLQHALMRTWEQWDKQGEIDSDDYDKIGRFEGALNKHAQDAYEKLDEAGRVIAERVFKRLAVKGAVGRETRSPAKLVVLWSICGADPEDQKQHVAHVVEHFRNVAGTFLTSDDKELDAESIIDITHESLIERWTTLKGWVQKEEESVRLFLRFLEDALDWRDRGRELLFGLSLKDAIDWNKERNPNPAWAREYVDAKTEPDPLGLIEKYLAKSSTAHRRHERRRHLIVAGVIALLVVVALVFWGLRRTAERNEAAATARQLVAKSQLLRTETLDAEPPTLLAAESMQRLPLLDNDRELRLDTALLPRIVSSLKHGGAVNAMAFSPDGLWVATASADRSARVFEARSGKEVSRLTHEGPVNAVAFSPDGRWVATASDDGTARVFEASSGHELWKRKQEGEVLKVLYSMDGQRLETSGKDKTAWVYEASSGKDISRLSLEAESDDVTYSPDGRWAAAVRQNQTASLYDAGTGKELWSSKLEGRAAVAFSLDGRWVATGDAYGTTRIFESNNGKEVSHLTGRGHVWAIAFSPDGKWVAVGGSAETRVYGVEPGSELWQSNQAGGVSAVVFSGDGRYLVTGSTDQTTRVFDARSGRKLSRLLQAGPVRTAAFSPDGRWVATGGDDKTATVFEGKSGLEVSSFGLPDSMFSIASSSSSWSIATGSQELQVFDLNSGRESFHSAWTPAFLVGVALSSAGQRVAGAFTNGEVLVFDVGSESQVSHVNGSSPLALSPDGKWLAATTTAGLRIFEASSGTEVSPIPGENVRAVTFSPDGRRAAVGSDDSTAMYETRSGKELWLVPHKGPLFALVFSGDGRWLAAGNSDRTVRVFETGGRKVIASTLLNEVATFLSFSPDGRTLVAGTSTAAHLIDIATSQETSRIETDGEVRAARFTEGGRYLELASNLGGRILVSRHSTRPQELIDEACSRLTRNLCLEEWRGYAGPSVPYHRTCPNLPIPPDCPGAR
jgi:WD40 repeat protein